MDFNSFIEKYKDFLQVNLNKIQDFKDLKNVRLFLQRMEIINSLKKRGFDLNVTGYSIIDFEKKINLKNIFTENSNIFKNFERILFIFSWAYDYQYNSLYQKIVELLNHIKTKYFENNINNQNESQNFITLEELLFYPLELKINRSQNLTNKLSLRLFYYSLKYLLKYENQSYSIEDIQNYFEIFKKNYYIDVFEAFAFHPSAKTTATSSLPQLISEQKKDYWAFKIISLFKESLEMQNNNLEHSELINNLNELEQKIIKRAFNIMDEEILDNTIEFNYTNFRCAEILFEEKRQINSQREIDIEKLKNKIKRIEIFYDKLLNYLFEINQFRMFIGLKLSDIEIIELPEETNPMIVNFAKKHNIISEKEFQMFKEINDNKSINICYKLGNLESDLKNLKDFDFIRYLIKSKVNALPLKEIQQFLDNPHIFLKYVFLGLIINKNSKIERFFKRIIKEKSKFDPNLIMISYKKMNLLVESNSIYKYIQDLTQFKKSSENTIPKYDGIDILALEYLKTQFSNIDVPNDLKTLEDYIVSPNAILKLNLNDLNIEGLRLTIYSNSKLLNELKNLKVYFDNFNEALHTFLERSPYSYRQFFNHNKNEIIDDLKILYDMGYHNILKIDIRRCTDYIEYQPLKYILSVVLPDSVAEIIFKCVKHYSIAFISERVTPKRGIAQGNPISTSLYQFLMGIHIYLTYISLKYISDKNVIAISFGDDLIITSKRLEDLEIFYTKLKENFAKIGWVINEAKSTLITGEKTNNFSCKDIRKDTEFELVGYRLVFKENKIFQYLHEKRFKRIQLRLIFWILDFFKNLSNGFEFEFNDFKKSYNDLIKDLGQIGWKNKKREDLDNMIADYIKRISLAFGQNISLEKPIDIYNLLKQFTNTIKNLEIFPRNTVKVNYAIYTDGAARPNPGHAGIGFVFIDLDSSRRKPFKDYIGIASNNKAEYLALYNALVKIRKDNLLTKNIQVFSDSQTLINHLHNHYIPHNKELRDIMKKIKKIESMIKEYGGTIKYQHISRRFNKEADQLSKDAINEYLEKEYWKKN